VSTVLIGLDTPFLHPVQALLSLSSPYNLAFLMCGLLFGTSLYLAARKRPLSLRALRRFLLPARVFLHPSAKLDYKYYFVIMALRGVLLGSMILSSALVAGVVFAALAHLFGPGPIVSAPTWVIAVTFTILQVVLFDLGYWIGHRLMHEVPVLWEFHKPHHAAEVLNPATAARAHPMEDLLQTNTVAMALGLGQALSMFVFGVEGQPLTLLETNVVFFVYFITIFHLRHGHIWLPVKGWLGHIIQSPAHHQIHHSTRPEHFGKNLGFSLSVWDWAFGTLYVPNKRETIAFGLGEESRDYRSITDLLVQPFIKVWRMATASASGQNTSAPIRQPISEPDSQSISQPVN
jgi:sterol desaturase/sphingolipid hydroxylase (fatty acid hydroxylase superfamily)